MRLDSSGNLGLGVTPSAWNAAIKALEMPDSGFLAFANTNGNISTNAFFDTGYKYKATAAAARYSQSSGQHLWFTAPSGTAGNAISFTQAMTLDASGRLGVGTTSPLARLSLGDLVAAQKFLLYDANNNFKYGFGIQADELRQFYPSDAAITFGTVSTSDGSTFTERARISSGGNLLAGTTTDNGYHTLQKNTENDWAVAVVSGASSPQGLLLRYTAASPNGVGNAFWLCFDGGGTTRASLRSNGGLANFQANDVNLSDRREKTNFAPAKSYLETICAIPVQTFNYIDQNHDEDPGLTLGVVAQDVQAVAPELVMESNWGTKEDPKMRLSIYQTDLQYALMKCIQEQQALIQTLTARVTALESN
jgi:hypothetical protein